MIRRVLVATDGSDAALAAVRTGAELTASLGPEAELHVVSAVDYAGVPPMLAKRPPGAPDLLADEAVRALAQAEAACGEAGVPVRARVVHGEVVEAILTYAREVRADILVAGYHGHNRFVRLVMGSVTGNLIRSTDLPVVVVRSEPAATPVSP
jgi:nucleotide-binding universal stress UspA family protein